MAFLSPLRYPGGKRQLSNFVKAVFRRNRLLDGTYVEPYAGGASIGLGLLFEEYARRIHVNDFDRSIFAFWYSTLNHTEELCAKIDRVPVTIDEWRQQRLVQDHKDSANLLDLGFSTFFLNRTNRSGIVTGGVIGGQEQTGKWLIDARFNKSALTERIRRVASYRNRISLTMADAADLLENLVPGLSRRSLLYLDPPYYVKGRQGLYANFYGHIDQERIAKIIRAVQSPWMVSYDHVPAVLKLYRGIRRCGYGLNYSAADRMSGREVLFFSPELDIPKVSNVIRVSDSEVMAA